MIFPTSMDYSRDRIKFYFNLFAFSFLSGEKDMFDRYKEEFLEEFKDTIDSDILRDISKLEINSDSFVQYLHNHPEIGRYDIDSSLVNYLTLKKIIMDYMINKLSLLIMI